MLNMIIITARPTTMPREPAASTYTTQAVTPNPATKGWIAQQLKLGYTFGSQTPLL